MYCEVFQMELGWIDFSKTDRSKALNVLELLEEKRTIDGLGISIIRDHYSNFFFPGTSTIQTRAKYFFIIPYIFRDLELSGHFDEELEDDFDKAEQKCAKCLLKNNPKEGGIIGKRAIGNDEWVQRSPADIYWSGLREYGFIDEEVICPNNDKNSDVPKRCSIGDCIRFISNQNFIRKEISDEDESLDSSYAIDLFDMSIYDDNWMKNIDINLTSSEGEILKNKIISNCENSLLAIILKENLYEEIFDLKCKYFKDLEPIIRKYPNKFPKCIQEKYYEALSFSNFIFDLRVIYNVMISSGENDEANELYESLDLKEDSKVNIDNIISFCEINDDDLIYFLNQSKILMENGKVDELKKLIKEHEIEIKGEDKAKTSNPDDSDNDKWYDGYMLDYRFYNAMKIVKDICKSENKCEED